MRNRLFRAGLVVATAVVGYAAMAPGIAGASPANTQHASPAAAGSPVTPASDHAQKMMAALRNADGTWASPGWLTVPGRPTVADPFVGYGISVAGMGDGTTQAMAIGTDRHLYHAVWQESRMCACWNAMPGANGAAFFSAYRVSVAGMPDGDLQVVAEGVDGNLWHNIRFPGGDWQGWRSVEGANGAAAFSDRGVAIAGMPNGDMQMVAIGNDGVVYHDVRYVGGGWQGWRQVQGANGAGSFVAQGVSIVGMRNGDAQIVAIGNDNLLYHDARYAGGGWQGWHAVEGANGAATFAAPPGGVAAAAMPDGGMQVIAVGNDGHLYHDIRFVNGTWQGWREVDVQRYANVAGMLTIAGLPDGDAYLIVPRGI